MFGHLFLQFSVDHTRFYLNGEIANVKVLNFIHILQAENRINC